MKVEDKPKQIQAIHGNQIMESLLNVDYEVIALIFTSTNRVIFYKKSQDKLLEPKEKSELYDDVVIGPLAELIVPQEFLYATGKLSIHAVVDALSKEETYACTYMVNQKDGTIGYNKWKFSYFDKEKGIILYTRSDITDIYKAEASQRKILRSALIQADQENHMNAELVSQISHEVRNPMNAIKGLSSQGARHGKMKKDLQKDMEEIKDLSRYLSVLINEILDYIMLKNNHVSLIESNFKVESWLREVNEKYERKARKKKIDYAVRFDSFLEDYYVGDRKKLNRIVQEILENAIRYTKEGGIIRLSVQSKKKSDEIRILKIVINDTGSGISEKFLPKIYTPFQRENKSVGTYRAGLGLSICKKLTKLLNGTIQVDSIEEVGTKVTVQIPFHVGTAKKEVKEKAGKMLAIVIHPQIAVCQYIRNELQAYNVETRWVNTRIQALRLMTLSQKQGDYFDFVFFDDSLIKKNEWGIIGKIRTYTKKNGSIVLMSNHLTKVCKENAKSYDIDVLLENPIEGKSLEVFMERILKENGSQGWKSCDFHGKRILIVEDHRLNAEIAKKLLEQKYATVEVVENGLAAIEEFISNEAFYYDAILMDIRMPLIDGLTASKSIRSTKKEDSKTIPIIAMSANVYDEDLEASKEAGMNAHIGKPIDTEVFYGTLCKFLFK